MIAHFQGLVPSSVDFKKTAVNGNYLYDQTRKTTYDVCIEQ